MAPPNYHNLQLSRSELDQISKDSGIATGLFQLLNNVTAVTKGEWTRWYPFSKGSFEATGINVGTVSLYTSNNPTCPLNGQTLTIGGSVTTGDKLTVTVNCPMLTISASYTTVGGDTTTTIAAGLVTALQAAVKVFQQQANLQGAFDNPDLIIESDWLTFSSSTNVLTINWIYPLVGVQIVTALSGGATETFTAAEYDSGLGFQVPNTQLTANGNVEFTQAGLWIKAVCSAYTSSTGSGIVANVVGSIP